MEDEIESISAPWWIWLGLSLIACASFWCQAAVTEERLVPALNVISEYYNIPSDIAGATLMAAGASSPELFSSIISLFVTHSSLGLVPLKIVGSEIFNQLVICAGSVYASKTGSLELDKVVVIREVSFYALAIALLYFALQDVEPDDDSLGVDHIYVSFWEACMLFGGYLLYVVVCAKMDTIVDFLSIGKQSIPQQSRTVYGAIEESEVPRDMPYVTKYDDLSDEPKSNWNHVEYTMPSESFLSERIASNSEGLRNQPSSLSSTASFRLQDMSFRRSVEMVDKNNSLVNLIKHTERPTNIFTMYDIEDNEATGVLKCFLWQQSPFYTNARFGSHAWHLRWFTITSEYLSSVPDRLDSERHTMRYPRFKQLQVDNSRLIIRMVNPLPYKRDYTIMAPSRRIFLAVLEKLEDYMEFNATLGPDDVKAAIIPADDGDFDGSEEYTSLIEFPVDGNLFQVVVFVFLFPVRFFMHFSIPDVRQLDSEGNATKDISMAMLATCMCLVWLVMGSYAMVASLESLAELLDIPDAVIGFTVSAAGTSLPNYVASKVAAENGFGNQAVSNAFGSNTFNILVGLGLPWLLYTSFGTGFKPYHGLPAEGILESIIILAVVLFVFIIIMLTNRFVLLKWHGILFLFMYAAYIVYAIAAVYLKS